ncbi:MAG: YfhO family protein [Deltaproteobacteria bacterium]|nr:YfhO family protein [Deltaproteobacteria bacterium]
MLTKRIFNRDGFALLILILLVVLFFGRVLFSEKVLYGSDFVTQFYPWKKFIYDSIRSDGSIPFWNPYLFSGVPFISNIQASMFYPLGFLYYLIPPEAAYVYSTVLHCILGAVFMYSFLRSLSVSPAGSFVSSIVFILNGFFMGHLYAGHLSFVQVYIWIPLIFFFMCRYVKTRDYRYAILSGLTLGVQILGGFPQLSFYTILALLLFSCYRCIIFWRDHDPKGAMRLSLGFGILVVTGLALAAVQVLPTMEFAGLSTRSGGVSYAFATYDSLHPKELLAFLVPYIFGSPVDGTYWRSPEVWHFWETCGYVGIIPIFLIFVQLQKDALRGLRIFFFGLMLFSLFLALGKHNPIYPLVYRLPGFDSFRIPAQIIFLYVFGIAVVSGIVLDQVAKGSWGPRKIGITPLAILGVGLVVFATGIAFFRYNTFFYLFRFFAEGPIGDAQLVGLFERVSRSLYQGGFIFFSTAVLLWASKRGKIQQGLFKGLISFLLVADLFLFGSEFVRTYTFELTPEKAQILPKLPRNPAGGRVVTLSNLFPANDGLRYRFPSVLGYDPLILKRYVEYVLVAQGVERPNPEDIVNLSLIKYPEAKLIGLLNARYLISGKDIKVLGAVVPYANLVSRSVVKSPEEILRFMNGDEFDPKSMVVFEPGTVKQVMSGGRTQARHGSSYSVIEYNTDDLRIRVETKKPAYLVLSEIYYPGWRARVDGKEVEVLCGNYIFRVIPLEAGEHEVQLYFISWPFRIGAIISVFALVLGIYLLLGRKKL